MNCPKCAPSARIYRFVLDTLSITAYACERCDSLWTHKDVIGASTAVPVSLFLTAQGLDPAKRDAFVRDYNWDGSATIAAARKALEGDPANVGYGIALATALQEANDPAGALHAFAQVLTLDPVNLQALYGAAQSAALSGDTAREQGYRRLLRALTGAGESSSTSAGASQAPTFGPPPVTAQDTTPDSPTEPLQAGTQPGDHSDDGETWRAERPWVTLADVKGMEQVKHRLNVSFLGPLRNPALRKMYGKSLRGGMLLFGPPGCGKTYIARATAGELSATFISVGLADVLDMWLGQSEQKLHGIFEAARRQRPAVLFFDEIDALGQRRSNLKHSAGRNIVNQLLAELDGIGDDNDGVFVLAATNHPWDVDAALLRPGRFDRTLLVLPPDEPARLAMIQSQLEERPTQGIDVPWLARQTRDFSGADITHLCDSAAENALEASIRTGQARPIAMDDFKRALREVRPSTRPWFDVVKNYVLYANESGAYDELAAYMRANKLL